ncbi:MAG: hypothetical protein ACQGVK_06470 [Myxococcota bacterium]
MSTSIQLSVEKARDALCGPTPASDCADTLAKLAAHVQPKVADLLDPSAGREVLAQPQRWSDYLVSGSLTSLESAVGEVGARALLEATATPWDILQGVVDDGVSLLLPAMSAIAAVGLLSMALLELVKVLPWRRAFNRAQFRLFIASNLRRLERALFPRVESEDDAAAQAARAAFREIHVPRTQQVIEEVEALAVSGNANALYDIDTAQFTGQVGAAMKLAVAYPWLYPGVVAGLAAAAPPVDLALVLSGPPDAAGKAAFTEARTRVTAIAQRSLDAMQISLGRRWARRQHLSACLISGTIIFGGVLWSYAGWPPGTAAVYWAAIAAFGGVTAPIANEVVKRLRAARTRTG